MHGIAQPDWNDTWSGGGYGKYRGIPMRDIRTRFDECVADPSMRSISAVLRITREQLDARGQLGVYPRLTLFAFVAMALAALGSLFAPPQLASGLQKVAVAAFAVGVALGFGAMSVRHTRRANLAQEREIREAAADAIERILSHGPKLRPLEREQRDVVKELIRKTGRTSLTTLLED